MRCRTGAVGEAFHQAPLSRGLLDGRRLLPRRLTISRRRRLGRDCLSSIALVLNEGFKLSIIVVVVIVIVILQLLEVDLVAENASDATKALHELVALGGPVRYKLQVRTELLVVLSDPLQEGFLVGNLHLLASGSIGLVKELFAIA